jgi:glycosyltransferase involved in cell wall biosynthesis
VRVGVLSTSYPREPGDPAGDFVAGCARELRRRGAEVEVLAAGPGDAGEPGIRVTRIPAAPGLFYDEGAPERLARSPRAWAAVPGFVARLWREARRRRWDFVISHWLLPSGVVGASLGRPHLAIAHSADVHLAARRGVADLTVAALLRPGTEIAFVAEHLRERLAGRLLDGGRRLRARSFVCPMGTDVRARAPRPSGRPPTILFLGRLVPIKGLPILVEAVARLGGVKLVIAGAGPEAEPVRALAEARGVAISLVGEVRGSVAKQALLDEADVVCVPSVSLPGGRTEGAPVVVLEALAAGVPLVASDLPGIRELAGGAAWLVPPGDPEALAGALRAALDEPGRHAVAAARIANAHGWPAIGDRLLGRLPYTGATREGDAHVEHG